VLLEALVEPAAVEVVSPVPAEVDEVPLPPAPEVAPTAPLPPPPLPSVSEEESSASQPERAKAQIARGAPRREKSRNEDMKAPGFDVDGGAWRVDIKVDASA
jgi:hypothetical protein